MVARTSLWACDRAGPNSSMKINPVITINEHTFVARHLRASSTVVDLGGNLGEFSRQVNARFGCTCYMVEPVPALFARLPRGPRLRAFNLAIAGDNSAREFHTAANITGGSLVRREGVPNGTILVQGTTLDDFVRDNAIERIDLLKVDIEGAEVALFETLSDETLARIRQITIEFHDFMPEVMSQQQVARIRQQLHNAGFRCLSWKMRSNFDVLFIRRELFSLPEYLLTAHIARPLSKIVARLPRLKNR